MDDSTPAEAPIVRICAILGSCLECGAIEHEPCRSPAGRRRRQPHRVRVLTRGIATMAVLDLIWSNPAAFARMIEGDA